MKYAAHIKPLIFSLIFLGGAVGGYAWVTVVLEEQGEKLQEQMLTIANQQAFEARFDELSKMVNETESERSQLAGYILKDDADTITLLSKFDDIAAKQNVDLKTSQLTVEEQKGPYNLLKLSYSLEGSETSVRRMIQLFETVPYHGYITSLSLQRSTNEATGAVEVESTIGLEITIEKYD